jgi:hypothetical protein
MSPPSERRPGRSPRLIGLVAAAVGFGIFAPAALFTMPLAALLMASQPRTTSEYAVAALAGGFAFWWLVTPGDLPDQLVRAAALFTTLAFTLSTLRTRASVTHRCLHAVAVAGAAVTGLLVFLGSSWGELRWWVAHRTGLAARSLMGLMWSATPVTANGNSSTPEHPALEQLQQWFAEVVVIVADFYPALLALEIMVGLALATAVYHRVARHPRGVPLAEFRNFRFSEHLGWAAAIPLIVVLIPKLAAAKVAAANLVVVAAALYGLRGIAVAAYGLQAVGAGGIFLTILLASIFVLLMPIVLAGAVVLGVVDAGLRLRERWGMKTAAK